MAAPPKPWQVERSATLSGDPLSRAPLGLGTPGASPAVEAEITAASTATSHSGASAITAATAGTPVPRYGLNPAPGYGMGSAYGAAAPYGAYSALGGPYGAGAAYSPAYGSYGGYGGGMGGYGMYGGHGGYGAGYSRFPRSGHSSYGPPMGGMGTNSFSFLSRMLEGFTWVNQITEVLGLSVEALHGVFGKVLPLGCGPHVCMCAHPRA